MNENKMSDTQKLADILVAAEKGKQIQMEYDAPTQLVDVDLTLYPVRYLLDNIDRIRIKPEAIATNIVRKCYMAPDVMVSTYDSTYEQSKHNVIITWDGETEKIKSVEIIND